MRVFSLFMVWAVFFSAPKCALSQTLFTESSKTGLPFLRIVPAARTSGMGSAGVSAPSGASSFWLNPALLALIDTRSAQFSHTELIEGIRQEFAAVSAKTGLGHLCAAVQLYDSGDIDAYGKIASPAGIYSIKYAAFSLSWAGRVGDNLALGVTYKKLLEKVAQEDAGGYAVDFGMTCGTPVNGLSLAAAMRNLGRMGILKNERTKLPTDGIVGFLYRGEIPRFQRTFAAVCDYVVPRYGKKGVRLGIEIDPVDRFHLRAGYRADSDTEDMSFGVGLEAGMFAADVSYTPMVEFKDNALRFTLSLAGF